MAAATGTPRPDIGSARRARALIARLHRTLASIAAAGTALLAACAAPSQAPPPHDDLFQDQLFAPTAVDVSPEQVFALSDAMRDYVRTEIQSQFRTNGAQLGLIDALLRKGQLKLDYDASVTRNAAEAFDARAGNCLSLVIMTAAFAKELGLPVRYQSAVREESWSRSGSLLLRTGHVNVTLGPPMQQRADPLSRSYTIDFLPPEDASKVRTREVTEQTIVAMFMNNRAVEAMLRGRIDEAYAWAREAVRQSPGFTSAVNTLGIVYVRHGDLGPAEVAFRRVLQLDPVHTRAMSNLAEVYLRQGRQGEAGELLRTLASIEPEPPYHYFSQGMAALKRNDLSTARDMFAREVARAGYSPEFHYWLGVTYSRLGNSEQASKHLNLALKNGAATGEGDQYPSTLSLLKAKGLQ
jgi:tetratricopeptide (TPR) repeat protein